MKILFVVLLIWEYVVSGTAAGSVDCDCGTKASGALLTYKGDPQGVLSLLKNGSECWFEENTAEASYTQTVYYEPQANSNCVFDKHPEMDTFSTTVQARMTFRSFENAGDEEFLIECNFETYADDAAGSTSVIEEPVKTIHVIHVDKGYQSNSSFTVDLVKIDGGIVQPPIHLGRMVRLRVVMTPASVNDTDFSVTSCDAESDNGDKSTSIIVSGCGTGHPFQKGKGFLKEGLEAFSPPFRAFVMNRRETNVRFRCKFIICAEGACGQSSCEAENEDLRQNNSTVQNDRRKRRSVKSLIQRKEKGTSFRMVQSSTEAMLITTEDSVIPVGAVSQDQTFGEHGRVQLINPQQHSNTKHDYKKAVAVSVPHSTEENGESPSRSDKVERNKLTEDSFEPADLVTNEKMKSSDAAKKMSVGVKDSVIPSSLKYLLYSDQKPRDSNDDIVLIVLLTVIAMILISVATSVLSAYFIFKKMNGGFRQNRVNITDIKTISGNDKKEGR